MRRVLTAVAALMLATAPAIAQQGPILIDELEANSSLADEIEVKAVAVWNLFFEGCILGRIDGGSRVATLDNHPALFRSPSAPQGLMSWGKEPDIIFFLGENLICTMAINDARLRDRMDKLIAASRMGLPGNLLAVNGTDTDPVSPSWLTGDSVAAASYAVQLPDSGMVLNLRLETSDGGGGMPPVILFAQYSEPTPSGGGVPKAP